MEKQEVPLTEDIIKKKTKGTSFALKIFVTLFYAFIFASLGILLILISYIFLLLGEIELMSITYFLFKTYIFLYLCALLTSLIHIINKGILKNKMDFQKRRKKIKEELKKEIRKELKNGRKK